MPLPALLGCFEIVRHRLRIEAANWVSFLFLLDSCIHGEFFKSFLRLKCNTSLENRKEDEKGAFYAAAQKLISLHP